MRHSALHPKLAHLSESQVEDLISRYYCGEKLTGLVAQFGIDCPISTFHKYLPAEISNQPCPNCGAVMELPRPCRKENRHNTDVLSRCTQCIHGNHRICRCHFCITEGDANKNNQPEPKPTTEQIDNDQSDHLCIKPEDLTLEQAVSILALTKGCYTINTNGGLLLFTSRLDKIPFAPTIELSDYLVNCLIEAGLLSVGIQPDINSEHISGRLITNGSKAPLQWQFPETSLETPIQAIVLAAKNSVWPAHWNGQLQGLVFAIAMAECIEFYNWCAKVRQFPDVEEKSKSGLIRNLLLDFSVGESCYLIACGARMSADMLVRQSILLDTPPIICWGLVNAGRTGQGNWDIKPFTRNVNCPRSMVSYVLYDTFLPIGEDFFTTPIALIKKPG